MITKKICGVGWLGDKDLKKYFLTHVYTFRVGSPKGFWFLKLIVYSNLSKQIFLYQNVYSHPVRGCSNNTDPSWPMPTSLGSLAWVVSLAPVVYFLQASLRVEPVPDMLDDLALPKWPDDTPKWRNISSCRLFGPIG